MKNPIKRFIFIEWINVLGLEYRVCVGLVYNFLKESFFKVDRELLYHKRILHVE